MARIFQIVGALATGLVFLLGCVGLVHGQGIMAQAPIDELKIERSHSRLVKLPRQLKRISVADDSVADVLVISPKVIYVNGLELGTTNITIWDRKEKIISQFKVSIGRDITKLKRTMAQLLPGEAIEIHELEGGVILSGRVSNDLVKSKADSVAKLVEKDRITNLLDVSDQKQVKLKLSFAEVNRNAMKRHNINLGYFNPLNAGEFFFTFLGGLTGAPTIDITKDSDGNVNYTIDQEKSSALQNWIGFTHNEGRYMAFLDILKEDGSARILAEPTLVCLSGQKSSFLAGGEFPIPVPGRDYASIVFRKYGVQLEFLPIVLPNGRIRLTVTPEVSELDYSVAQVTGGYTIPGLTTRSAKTQLELNDGQEFAIAGLFRQDVTKVTSKVPLLGDIPILGALFRSSEFTRKETDLMIIVSPHIVMPGEGAPENLPSGVSFDMPSDWSFYLFDNWLKEGDYMTNESSRSMLKMEGEFGHEIKY